MLDNQISKKNRRTVIPQAHKHWRAVRVFQNSKTSFFASTCLNQNLDRMRCVRPIQVNFEPKTYPMFNSYFPVFAEVHSQGRRRVHGKYQCCQCLLFLHFSHCRYLGSFVPLPFELPKWAEKTTARATPTTKTTTTTTTRRRKSKDFKVFHVLSLKAREGRGNVAALSRLWPRSYPASF